MPHFTVYVTRKVWDSVCRLLEKVGTVIIWNDEKPVPREELLKRVREADALLCVGDDLIDREVIQAATRLRVISTMSSDASHIDLDAAAKRGIIVCTSAATADESVADLTMALLLASARKLSDADQFVKKHEWHYWSPELFLGLEVKGSTLGIIGLGYVGLEVAHRARGFGMRVLYYDLQRNRDAEESLGLQYGSLENVLREADFITLHLPLTPETYCIINDNRLKIMKDNAVIINTAHGSLVDHDSLVRALKEGWIAGAGLDVFEHEPLPADDPLFELNNVVLTPHISANTYRGMITSMRIAAEQIVDVLEGRKPANQVQKHDEAA